MAGGGDACRATAENATDGRKVGGHAATATLPNRAWDEGLRPAAERDVLMKEKEGGRGGLT